MSEEKKQDFEFEELLKYRDLVVQNMNYSVQRIDILIIALCTSGIILCLTTMEDNKDVQELKIAILFFTISIAINLLSQFVGYYANRKLVMIYNQKVVDYKSDPESFNEDDYEEDSEGAYKLGSVVHYLNILSFICLLVGMTACLFYEQ